MMEKAAENENKRAKRVGVTVMHWSAIAAAAATRTRSRNSLINNIGAGGANSLNLWWSALERRPNPTSGVRVLNLIRNKEAIPFQYHRRRRNIVKLTSLLTAPSSSSPSSTMSQIHTVVSQNEGQDHNVFPLSPSTGDAVLKINKGDITKWFVDASSDAIVNPVNERMLGGGGADGAIHRAAGPELRDACYSVPEVRPGVRCPTGEARITPGFKLPVTHVIHTVGPIYDADPNSEASLRNAYRNSLIVAKDNNIKYIAFPAISCGVFGYPFEEAATVAISAVREFLGDFKEIHFVLFSDEIYNVWLQKAKELLQI